MKNLLLILLIIITILIASKAWALSSTNYQCDWFTPLTSGAGGKVSSTNYTGNFTVGQAVIVTTLNSTTYKGCLGYWCGAEPGNQVYLPLILKGY